MLLVCVGLLQFAHLTPFGLKMLYLLLLVRHVMRSCVMLSLTQVWMNHSCSLCCWSNSKCSLWNIFKS